MAMARAGKSTFCWNESPKRTAQRNAGLWIDHLLLNAELTPALVAVGVDAWVRGEQGASDHAPAWIELDLSKLKGKGALKTVATPAGRKSVAKKAAARKSPNSPPDQKVRDRPTVLQARGAVPATVKTHSEREHP